VQRTITIASQDTVAEEHDVTIEAEMLETEVTANHTARVKFTITNANSDQLVSVGGQGENGCGLFNRSLGWSDDLAGLWLVNPTESRNIDRKEDRWVPDRDADEPWSTDMYGCVSIDYVETLTNEYLVWDDYRTEQYLQPGEYRFERDVSIKENSETPSEAEQVAEFTWGFTLSVDRPE
jgi:hypothetical protein